MHAIVFSPDAAKLRAFFADVLNFRRLTRGAAGLFSRCRPPNSPSIRLTVTAAMSFT
jgi:hypothetical protein